MLRAFAVVSTLLFAVAFGALTGHTLLEALRGSVDELVLLLPAAGLVLALAVLWAVARRDAPRAAVRAGAIAGLTGLLGVVVGFLALVALLNDGACEQASGCGDQTFVVLLPVATLLLVATWVATGVTAVVLAVAQRRRAD